MAIAFAERDTSPELALDGATTRWWVTGETDETVVQTTLSANTPATIGSLIRTNIRIVPTGPGMWDGEITYTASASSQPPTMSAPTFSFDTGGGTQHVTQALATVATFAPAGKTAPNFKGAIGVTADSVEGVDVIAPKYQFSETHVLPDSTVTDTYKSTLMIMTGTVNSAAFRTLVAGSVLFLGASGAKRGDGDWEIAYRFAASPPVSGLTVGDITGISKDGWEYLWVRYEDTEDVAAKRIIKTPTAAYVEKVYNSTDFTLLGI